MSHEEEDVRVINRVAQFWRELLGEEEFQKYMPADLFRWYNALENRSPLAVRQIIDERTTGRHRLKILLGIVPSAPHPPVSLVVQWVRKREEQTARFPTWSVTALVLLLSLLVLPKLTSCTAQPPPPWMEFHPHTDEPGQATLQLPGMQVNPIPSPGFNAPAPQPAPYSAISPPTTPTEPSPPQPPTGASTPGGGSAPPN